jgi:hypothetical protein
VRHLAEVALAQAQERAAVDLAVAADEVMQGGAERLPARIGPGLLRLIEPLDEDGLAAPVLLGTRQVIATFEDQDALAGRCQALRERGATRPAADDDQVVVVLNQGGYSEPVRLCCPATAGAQRGSKPNRR